MKLQQSNDKLDTMQSDPHSPQSAIDSAQLPQPSFVVPQIPERTFGQKLADKMASKVGSWGFLIGQTTVLTAWVGCNLMPGLPHWDESPFILLNLVFSFASAYTAPVVLMSQNRQSDEDRAHAMQNYQVNLQTAHNLELLQQKMDAVYSQRLAELTELIQKQSAHNEAANHLMTQVTTLQPPNYVGLLPSNMVHSQHSHVLPIVDGELFTQSVVKPEDVEASSSHQ